MVHGSRSGRRRIRAFRGALMLASTLLACLTAELAVRAVGHTDADGNFFFRGRVVGPVHPPVARIRRILDDYRNSETSRMVYAPHTGWEPRAGSVHHDGMYCYNAAGIRVPRPPTEDATDRLPPHAAEHRRNAPADDPARGGFRKYAQRPPEGTLRIALFGDSFTHGDDVFFRQTWGHRLERRLNESGSSVEVINFGVSAYGMDQAFLRWGEIGRTFHPDVVLFGFQAENVARNVNIFRGLYAPNSGIPFTKPRFVLRDDGSLTAVNCPALEPAEIPEAMGHLPDTDLARHEWFYNPEAERGRFWHRSRFLTLAADVLGGGSPSWRRRGNVFRIDGEPARVTLKLLERFRNDVESTGAEFILVHLPKRADLERLLAGRDVPYADLLARVRQKHTVIDVQPDLLAAAKQTSLDRLFQRHYSPRGNRIVAQAVAEPLRQSVASR